MRIGVITDLLKVSGAGLIYGCVYLVVGLISEKSYSPAG